MPQADTFTCRDVCKRVNLSYDEICNLLRWELQIAAAEVFAVVESWMCADRNAMRMRQPDRLTHDSVITSM
jgi:hypothetical protein